MLSVKGIARVLTSEVRVVLSMSLHQRVSTVKSENMTSQSADLVSGSEIPDDSELVTTSSAAVKDGIEIIFFEVRGSTPKCVTLGKY